MIATFKVSSIMFQLSSPLSLRVQKKPKKKNSTPKQMPLSSSKYFPYLSSRAPYTNDPTSPQRIKQAPNIPESLAVQLKGWTMVLMIAPIVVQNPYISMKQTEIQKKFLFLANSLSSFLKSSSFAGSEPDFGWVFEACVVEGVDGADCAGVTSRVCSIAE